MQMWEFFTPHASWRLFFTSDIFNTYGVSGLGRVSKFSWSVVNLRQTFVFTFSIIYLPAWVAIEPGTFRTEVLLANCCLNRILSKVCTHTEFRSKAANRVTDIHRRHADHAQDEGRETAYGIAIRYRVSGSGVRTSLRAKDFILSTPV